MKKVYLTPVVEVMNARVEKGFGTSGGSVTPSRPDEPWHGVDQSNYVAPTGLQFD